MTPDEHKAKAEALIEEWHSLNPDEVSAVDLAAILQLAQVHATLGTIRPHPAYEDVPWQP